MNQNELEKNLRAMESDRVERTVSKDKTDKFCEAICAFANDMPNHGLPGYLFVGVTDQGNPSGLVITDELLRNLADLRDNGTIQPLPRMNVEKREFGGTSIAVVEVFPSEQPPVRYKGRTWIRVGPRKALATAAEERVLSERRATRAQTWDARPCRTAELDDLAQDIFRLSYLPNAISRDVLDENGRTPEQQLAALRLFDLKAQVPTHGAILIFANEPLAWIPGAYVQYVHYDGVSLADDVRQERRLTGDLLSVLRASEQLGLEIAGEKPVVDAGFRERTVSEYPIKAVRGRLMIAIIHLDYENFTAPIMVNHFADRLEIHNPGGLYGDLKIEDFSHATAYRNPLIAEAAKVFGFVNRFGRGLAVAQAALQKNGSPPAEFDLRTHHVLVTIRRGGS